MANYSVNLTDNGNGSWTITDLLRAPTTNASGGTSLNTNTYTVTAATGALATASGFLDTTTALSDGLGHVHRNPQEALAFCQMRIANDRSFNG